MAGLQGGLQNLVESMYENKVNTEIALKLLTETMKKIMERVSQEPHSRGDNKQSNTSKELNQVKDCVCQLQNVITKEMTSIAEDMRGLEKNVKTSSEVYNSISSEIITSIEENNRQSIKEITKVITSNKRPTDAHDCTKVTDVTNNIAVNRGRKDDYAPVENASNLHNTRY